MTATPRPLPAILYGGLFAGLGDITQAFVFFGILGDRMGRLTTLFGSILLYSVANIANGLVDGFGAYAAWRFIAGIGLAGELGGCIALVSETLSKERRGYGTALVATVGVFGAEQALADGQHELVDVGHRRLTAGAQHQIDLGVGRGIGREQRRQAKGGGRLERSDRQGACRLAVVARRACGFFEEGLEALRVRDEASPGGGQPGTGAAALKQRDTQRLFQPPHPLGDVGLNGIDGACGTAHAAQTGDRGEGGEISTFHRIRISDG